RAEVAFGTDEIVGSIGAGRSGEGANAAMEKADALDRKFSQGNPTAARGLAKLEAKSIETGKSPKELKNQKSATSTQEAKLLTILVEFNDAANDDFTGAYVPEAFGATTCKPGDVQNGPLHNNIPDPATYELEDNNTLWVPDFSSEHFNKMLFTDEGIT